VDFTGSQWGVFAKDEDWRESAREPNARIWVHGQKEVGNGEGVRDVMIQ